MGLVVNRWRGHGLERLYVNDEESKEGVAFYDYKTGRLVVKEESRSDEVLEVLRPFLGSSVPDALRDLMVDSPPSPESDLTRNQAGQAVAARAAELRPRGFQGIASRIIGLRTASTSWEAGTKGEQFVNKRLGRLKNDGWHILPSLVKRSGVDIDHVVIGPPGVFTVNTKHHRGAHVWVDDDVIKVDNVQRPYLRNSRHEAESAAHVLTSAVGLEVRVTPVLAFVGAESIRYASSQNDVLVTRGEELDQILRELPPVYSFQERERILAIARRAEIWLA